MMVKTLESLILDMLFVFSITASIKQTKVTLTYLLVKMLKTKVEQF